ncbi:hypothetical protein ABT063_46590 [Streptomyces sp. NPDC002838]|uniref:hypothetical protein n=1 Tax=Streptomyces sp. NPDC002838 TaxID=3154436 RepID=UPI003318EF6C
MRELIGKRPWLTVFRFPTYTQGHDHLASISAFRPGDCDDLDGRDVPVRIDTPGRKSKQERGTFWSQLAFLGEHLSLSLVPWV